MLPCSICLVSELYLDVIVYCCQDIRNILASKMSSQTPRTLHAMTVEAVHSHQIGGCRCSARKPEMGTALPEALATDERPCGPARNESDPVLTRGPAIPQDSSSIILICGKYLIGTP